VDSCVTSSSKLHAHICFYRYEFLPILVRCVAWATDFVRSWRSRCTRVISARNVSSATCQSRHDDAYDETCFRISCVQRIFIFALTRITAAADATRFIIPYIRHARSISSVSSRGALCICREQTRSWSNSASLSLCTRYFIYWWKYGSDRICWACNGKYLWRFANAILFGSVIIANREYQIYVRVSRNEAGLNFTQFGFAGFHSLSMQTYAHPKRFSVSNHSISYDTRYQHRFSDASLLYDRCHVVVCID